MARRTQAQLAQTRQAIIASAKQLFSDKGFARTQVHECVLWSV
jgi:AcrR family transcriptional regulator